MEKNYDHQNEENIAKQWEASGLFEAPEAKVAKEKGQKPFCIIMPPPNANDPLHVGHAMFVTVEDILARYHRMKGEAVCWLPGTDHAGIETQFVFEKKLAKEGKSRYDFDRKTLYRMVEAYVTENSGVAIEQMKRLGASADWGRYKFTLDKEVVDFVYTTFDRLHQEGLVYRGQRLVNYCVKCGTSYSELEVEYEEKEGKLYFIAYPMVEGGEIIVATTRPETMLGDTAVAVNPKDNRYQHLIGKKIRLPLTDREIPIIADEMVDLEFGTGAVKVTPAHDMSDYEIGLRHKLEMIQVIDFSGRMTDRAGKFSGMKVKEAREAILADLKDLIKETKIIQHNVGGCYRCGNSLEPLPLAQFFVKTRGLADKAIEALDKKETVVLGAGREKILRDWLENIKDWNISRQIVWGIRIPVWYSVLENPDLEVSWINREGEREKGLIREILKDNPLEEVRAGLQSIKAPVNARFVVGVEKPGEKFLPETDTFDTWFSSGQWPVVTLKTNEPGDFEYYYPTAVMETAYDILTRWVMRMMILGIYLTDQSPFTSVYLHGLVRDERGKKMSKSLGNAVNPLDLIDKYGADALRMALVMSTTPGNDSSVGEGKVRGMRNLANKIWNAARFVKEFEGNGKTSPEKEFETRLSEIVLETNKHLDKLRIGLAAEYLYNEFWHWYCDEMIESAKLGKVGKIKMEEGLKVFLKLFQPFVPFVTEVVWKEMGEEKLLAGESWPVYDG
jgi:valyl-tRNA synthetase